MDLNNLRDRAYKNAVAHGWHEENLSDEHFLCLVMSELMEAVEADRKGDYAGDGMKELFEADLASGEDFNNLFESHLKSTVEEELADACIRLFDLAGLRGTDITYIDCLYVPTKILFTEYIYVLCSVISNPDKAGWLLNRIEYCLGFIFSWCKDKKIDIMWYIEQKMRYNEQRPYKHGNKKY